MGPNGKELEFIIRFKEQAAAAINRVRQSLRGLGTSSKTAQSELTRAAQATNAVQQKFTTAGASANVLRAQTLLAAQSFAKFNGGATRAAAAAEKVGKKSKKAGDEQEKAGKKSDFFGNAMRNTTKSVQLALGPLSGISARLTAFTGIVQQASFRIAGFSAALVGMVTFTALARKAAKEIDKTFKASQRLGIGFENFQELGFVASQSGIDLAQFTKGMEALTSRVSDAAGGLGDARRALAGLGLDFRNLNKQAPIDQLELIRGAMEGITNETDRAAASAKIFSRANIQFANLLRISSKDFEALRTQAREYGLVLSQEVAEDAVRATDAMDLLNKVIGVNFQRVLSQIFPAITRFSKFVARIGPVVKDNADIIISALTGVAGVLTGLFVFAKVPLGGVLALALGAIGAAAVFAFVNLDLVIKKLKELEQVGVSKSVSGIGNRISDAVDRALQRLNIKGGFGLAKGAVRIFNPEQAKEDLRKLDAAQKEAERQVESRERLTGRQRTAQLSRNLLRQRRERSLRAQGFDPSISDFDEDDNPSALAGVREGKSILDEMVTKVREILESFQGDFKKAILGALPKVGLDKFAIQFRKAKDLLVREAQDLDFINDSLSGVSDNFADAANKSRLFEVALQSQQTLMQATGLEARELPSIGSIMSVLAGNTADWADELGATSLEMRRVLELLELIRDVENSRGIRASNERIRGLGMELDLVRLRANTMNMTADEQERIVRLRETENNLIATGVLRGTAQFDAEVKITDELIRREQQLRKVEAARDALTTASERGIQDIGQAFSDVFLDAEKGFADLEATATDVFKKITDMVIQLAIINPAINSLGLAGGGGLPTLNFSGLGGSGNPFTNIQSALGFNTGGALEGFDFAKGGIFNSLGVIDSISKRTIKNAAKGMVLRSPTTIATDSNIINAREAGQDEGILPLRRMRNGDLGVSADSGGGQGVFAPTVNIIQNITADNPVTFRATVGQQFRDAQRGANRMLQRNG